MNKNLEIIPADTFDELMIKAEDNLLTDCALMAIENTIAGTILKNYRLLSNYLVLKLVILVLHFQLFLNRYFVRFKFYFSKPY